MARTIAQELAAIEAEDLAKLEAEERRRTRSRSSGPSPRLPVPAGRTPATGHDPGHGHRTGPRRPLVPRLRRSRTSGPTTPGPGEPKGPAGTRGALRLGPAPW